MEVLKEVMTRLIQEIPLDAKHRNHRLSGDYKGSWECHIEPDWLLIYQVNDKSGEILFERLGTHSDLFG